MRSERCAVNLQQQRTPNTNNSRATKMSNAIETYEKDLEDAATASISGTGTNLACQNKTNIIALLDQAAALAPIPANYIIIGAKLAFNVWCEKHCEA